MDETQFLNLAEAELTKLESMIEHATDAAGVDCDIEPQEGIVELEFADGSKIIINRHVAAREIWVAARSGGFHFQYDGNLWRNTRDHSLLYDVLSKLISQQCRAPIQLDDKG